MSKRNIIGYAVTKRDMEFFDLFYGQKMIVPAGTTVQRIGKTYMYGGFEREPGMHYVESVASGRKTFTKFPVGGK